MAFSRIGWVVGLAVSAIAGHAIAGEASGKVIAVIQQTSVDGATGTAILMADEPVYSGDRINTGPIGEAQIRFRDETKLVVGPNSSLVIDAFVFNSDGTANKFTINALRGAFRFITGNSSKDAYTIVTPTSTIGVRGTQFDIAIEKQGTTRVVNFEGVTRICRRRPDGGLVDPAKDCVETRDPCTFSIARAKEPIVKYGGEDIAWRNRQLTKYFPYFENQASLLPDFQVDLKKCGVAQIESEPGLPPPPPPPGPPTCEVDCEIPPPPPPLTPPYGHYRSIYDHGPVVRH